jgi:septal ring factor EnvC (AmiA/AmiB activator)
MKPILSALLVATCLLAACSSTRESETSEIRSGMKQQMATVRAQMKTSGATAAQLRDFDRAMVEMDRQMRALERQMKALEQASRD